MTPPQEFSQRYLDDKKATGKQPGKGFGPLESALFETTFHRTYCRTRTGKVVPTKLVDVWHPGSICIPGHRKCMVNHEGYIYACEKCPETDLFRIGDVEKGIDVKKVQELIKNYTDLTAEDCKNCWTLRMCDIGCFKDILEEERMSVKKKKQRCEKNREIMDRELATMCDILEINPNALSFLDEIDFT